MARSEVAGANQTKLVAQFPVFGSKLGGESVETGLFHGAKFALQRPFLFFGRVPDQCPKVGDVTEDGPHEVSRRAGALRSVSVAMASAGFSDSAAWLLSSLSPSSRGQMW